ncbi:MAG: hypothetical protein JW969_04835 [Spirochaetales bacterium]|nr:hypothetical protein [Spirochaetales bacterium]
MLEVINANKIFIMNHNAGEILSINVSGLKDDTSPMRAIMDDMFSRLAKPSVTRNIAFHIYGTRVSEPDAARIAAAFKEHEGHIRRLAIVGAGFMSLWRLKKCVRKQGINVPVRFIFDINEAKDWLTGGH